MRSDDRFTPASHVLRHTGGVNDISATSIMLRDGRRLAYGEYGESSRVAIVSGACATAPGYAQRKNMFKRAFYAIAARATAAWAPVTAWWMMRGLRRTKPDRLTTWPDPVVLKRPGMRRLWRDALLEGFRNGSRGVAQDIRVLAGKWDFRLEDIEARVHVWHGDKDRVVPIAIGRYVAETIP